MNESFRAIVEAAGGTPVSGTPPTSRSGHLHEGGVAREVGTVRMGSDPKTSALNGFCQAHDVRNLFVTDGASFTTNPDKNPTATILAVSGASARPVQKIEPVGRLSSLAGLLALFGRGHKLELVRREGQISNLTVCAQWAERLAIQSHFQAGRVANP